MELSDEEIRIIILDIIKRLDYDQYKHFVEETSEHWEQAQIQMAELVEVFKNPSLKRKTS